MVIDILLFIFICAESKVYSEDIKWDIRIIANAMEALILLIR